MILAADEVALWATRLLPLTANEEAMKLSALSADEQIRAQRFRFTQHRQRFIAARHTLRLILSHYLNQPLTTIQFFYGEQKKPSVSYPLSTIHFNLSHSEDCAVFAFTHHHPLGIDIEKVSARQQNDIIDRFFHPNEKQFLFRLNQQERLATFFCIWARKEAVLKACGKGLTIALAEFSVLDDDISAPICVNGTDWLILPFDESPVFKAALALKPVPHFFTYWMMDQASATYQQHSNLNSSLFGP